MKGIILNILSLLIILLSQAFFAGCSHDRSREPADAIGLGKMGALSIHIKPVNYSSRVDNGSTEMIKSVRIIVFNTDSVELNRFVDINKEIPGGVTSLRYQYDFLYRTVKGDKSFFLIANEESVTSTITKDQNALENNTTFSEILDGFEVGYEDLETMKTLLNSIYFYPEYSSDGGNIYLPYSSYYTGINVKEKEQIDVDMYLVPVATKFIFNFTNNRPNGVYLSQISINEVNTSNYFLAQVDEKDMSKTLPGETEGIYWVDWLGQISELSQEESGYYPNINFNKRYGWIRYYDMPDENDTEQSHFFLLSLTDQIVIPGTSEQGQNTYMAGPFYLPESRTNLENIPDPDNEGAVIEVQNYQLSLGFKDTIEENDAPPFQNVNFLNLESLFRNTCVVVNIKFSQGELEVYAELSPWNVKTAKGWVTEGDKPK